MNYPALLKVAYDQASLSPDKSNQNGALLVDITGKILVMGYNKFPRGVEVTPELLANRDEKLQYITHAEEAVIVNAASMGIKTSGLTMICPWAACMPCARDIINSHVQTLVIHADRMATTPERWQAEVNKALSWLTNAGVEIIWTRGPITGAPEIMVNGAIWKP